jgi:hypothetical protein
MSFGITHRLAHAHSRRMSDLHKYAKGIPQIPLATDLRKAARGQIDSRHATQQPVQSGHFG